MTRPLTHRIEFALPGQNAVLTCAVCTFDETTAAVPYVREVATLRIHDASAINMTVGTPVALCGQSWAVYELKKRPKRGWVTAKVAHVRPEPATGAWRGGAIVVMRPVHRAGLDAATLDEVAFRNEAAVFAPLPKRRDSVEATAYETTAKAACYVPHNVGLDVAPGWSVWDGTDRWRVDDVADVGKVDRLPMLAVTKTGLGI